MKKIIKDQVVKQNIAQRIVFQDVNNQEYVINVHQDTQVMIVQ